MKKILLSTTVLLISYMGDVSYSFANDEPLSREEASIKVSRLQRSVSLPNTGSVQDKVRIFQEFSDKSNARDSGGSKISASQEEKAKLPSTGQVNIIRRLFQRNSSKEQLPLVNQGSKNLSPQALSSSISSSSSSSSSPHKSPKSPRNLYNKFVKARSNISESLEELPKKEEPKSKKKEKGSRSKPPKNFEVSPPTVNPSQTKQRTLNSGNIEQEWESRIEDFYTLKGNIQEHIREGTISKTDERYIYVLKGDLEEFEMMYIKGMHYIKGKNSLRKQEEVSLIQTMGQWLTDIKLERDWITGKGDLTSDHLKLFETKLRDAKGNQKTTTSLGEAQENLSKICITHPSPQRRRAHTTKGSSGSEGVGKRL